MVADELLGIWGCMGGMGQITWCLLHFIPSVMQVHWRIRARQSFDVLKGSLGLLSGKENRLYAIGTKGEAEKAARNTLHGSK